MGRIQKELHNILRIGNNLHSGFVDNGEKLFMCNNLEHFKLYNTYNNRNKGFVMPMLTAENIGVTGRSGNQFQSQCGSFCAAVEYSSCDYSDYVNNCVPYLLLHGMQDFLASIMKCLCY